MIIMGCGVDREQANDLIAMGFTTVYSSSPGFCISYNSSDCGKSTATNCLIKTTIPPKGSGLPTTVRCLTEDPSAAIANGIVNNGDVIIDDSIEESISDDENSISNGDPLYYSTVNDFPDITNSNDVLFYTEGESFIRHFIAGVVDTALEIKGEYTNVYSLSPIEYSGTSIIKPFGNSDRDFTSGSISLWVNFDSTIIKPFTILPINPSPVASAKSRLYMIDEISKLQVVIESNDENNSLLGKIFISNELKNSFTIGNKNAWHHIYTIWDETRFTIFIDNAEKYSYIGTMPNLKNVNLKFKLNTYTMSQCGLQWYWTVDWLGHKTYQWLLYPWTANTKFRIDNIKVWDKIISSNPSFEFNNGEGI